MSRRSTAIKMQKKNRTTSRQCVGHERKRKICNGRDWEPVENKRIGAHKHTWIMRLKRMEPMRWWIIIILIIELLQICLEAWSRARKMNGLLLINKIWLQVVIKVRVLGWPYFEQQQKTVESIRLFGIYSAVAVQSGRSEEHGNDFIRGCRLFLFWAYWKKCFGVCMWAGQGTGTRQ